MSPTPLQRLAQRKERIQIRTRYIRLRVPSQPVKTANKPTTTYQVLSFSLFTDDVKKLDSIVGKLRASGESKASRSMVVQRAIRLLFGDIVVSDWI